MMQIVEVEYEKVLEIRQEVMYPNEDIDFVKLEDDANGIHVGIYDNEVLASVVSIFIKDRDIQFRKLATRTEFERKGYATALFKWILAYANEMIFNKVWANSRVEIIPFYEKLDFKQTDNTFSKNGHNYVVVEYKIENTSNN